MSNHSSPIIQQSAQECECGLPLPVDVGKTAILTTCRCPCGRVFVFAELFNTWRLESEDGKSYDPADCPWLGEESDSSTCEMLEKLREWTESAIEQEKMNLDTACNRSAEEQILSAIEAYEFVLDKLDELIGDGE